MIQWLTTVAPSTTASSSSSSSSSSSASYAGGNTLFNSSRSQSGSTSASASWDWSHTASNSGTTTQFSSGQTSSLTDSNGNVTDTQIINDGNVQGSAFPTTINLTNFRSVQTSTTVSATYRVQGEPPSTTAFSEVVGATQWTTAVFESGTSSSTLFLPTAADASQMTTATRPTVSSESVTTTTLTQTELDPSFYATIYQTGGNIASFLGHPNNEVLWFLDTYSAQIFDGNYSAASKWASTGERFTAMPWTATSEAGVTATTARSTFAGTTVSTEFVLQKTATTESMRTVASGDVALGKTTIEETFPNHTNSQTTSSITFINFPQFLSAASTKSAECWFVSSQKTTEYASIVSGGVENTGEALWVSLTSSTYRTSLQTLSTASSSGNSGTSQSASGISRSSQVYRTAPLGVTTAAQNNELDFLGAGWEELGQPPNNAATYAPRAVIDPNGDLFLYYSSPETIEAVERVFESETSVFFVPESRGIETIFPASYSFTNQNWEVTGRLSVSGLTISATSISTAQTSGEATTTSFAITASEATNIGELLVTPSSSFAPLGPAASFSFGGSLGQKESAFSTVRPGVYRVYDSNGSTATVSTTGAIGSWTGSMATSRLQAITFLVPAFLSVRPVVWTATRNNNIVLNQFGETVLRP